MTEDAIYLWITVILCLDVAVLFFLSRRKAVNEKGITKYYQWICAAVFIWLFFTSFLYSEMDMSTAYVIAMWRYVGIALMPISTMLHIWQQLSPSSIPNKKLILYLIPPLFSSILAVTNEYTGFFIKSYWLANPGINRALHFDNNWGFYLHCVISYVAIIVSLVLILQVFFRIPKRMRKTIILMVYAALVPVICNILILLFLGKIATYDTTIFATIISLHLFYLALNTTRSSNLIITSREYVWDNLSSMTLVLDAEDRILDYNKAMDMEKLGFPLPLFMEPYEEFRERWINAGNGMVSMYNRNVVTFVGETSESHYRIRPHAIIEKGSSLGTLVEISEITEIYTLLRYLEDSAQRDHLTGLNNRNSFIRLSPEFCRAECLPLLVIIGDANKLKAVNDRVGHIVGDKLIQKLAEILTACAPRNTFIARIGGDEFILLIPCATQEYGEVYIRQVQSQCEKITGEPYGVPGISLGASVLQNADQPLHDVIEEADRNMYLNKRKGSESDTRHRYNPDYLNL